jgi:DNA-directed RNA polymerase specialized sigma24 family protein
MMDYKKLTAAVERAAAIAASKFPAHHDVSDVKQEIWVWIMENKNTVSRVLAEDDWEAKLVNNYLIRAGQTALRKEDAASYGYSEEDQFVYPLEMIKSILEVVFNHEDWQSFAQSQDGMPRAKSEPALGGNNLASYADVSRAVETLPEDQYNVLVWRYKYHYTFQRIAEEIGLTNQGAQDRHRGAVAAIQQYLGKRDLGELRRGYEGRTEPRTTASAVAVTERDYEG